MKIIKVPLLLIPVFTMAMDQNQLALRATHKSSMANKITVPRSLDDLSLEDLQKNFTQLRENQDFQDAISSLIKSRSISFCEHFVLSSSMMATSLSFDMASYIAVSDPAITPALLLFTIPLSLVTKGISAKIIHDYRTKNKKLKLLTDMQKDN
ncbi:MAG: hypothetical protein M1114_01475 [Candidatus Dependentiae bacterium]|nr:hypothetical protein [Candidatus Dependentiae bacterium]